MWRNAVDNIINDNLKNKIALKDSAITKILKK